MRQIADGKEELPDERTVVVTETAKVFGVSSGQGKEDRKEET